MSNVQPGQEPAEPGVFHHKTETITTDHEKVIAALAPLAEQFAPVVQAWRTAELEKVKTVESEATRRQIWSSASLVAVVGLVAWLAFEAMTANLPGTAEKIVIGLLAFLGGLGARR